MSHDDTTRGPGRTTSSWAVDATPRGICDLRAPLNRFFQRRGTANAEDLVQDTLVALLRGLNTFRGGSTFATYVFAVASRLDRRERRRKERAWAHVSLSEEAETPATPDVVRSRVASVLLDEVRLEEIFQALKQSDRDLLRLYFWEGLSGPEVAAQLGLPEPTVRSRLRRAVAQVRGELEVQA